MLAARDLCFSFGPNPGGPSQVLSSIGFSAESGSCTAIIGPNGAGKSTLLRLLGGHLSPTAGTATLSGRPVAAIAPRARARQIAIIPQAASLAFPFTVARFVAFGRYALGNACLDAAVTDALHRVDLAARAADPVGELSQGQQQRASIARALCQLAGMPSGDRYLLADEPTASLDPAHALIVRSLFAELADQSIGVVATLHDLGAAAAFDQILLLGENGSPVGIGAPSDVLTDQRLKAAFDVAFDRHRDAEGRLVALTPARPVDTEPQSRDVHFTR